VPESSELLDNTDVHPEQYILAKYIIDHKLQKSDFESHKEALISIYPDVNMSTLGFIVDAY
jgi:transcriptional accessory protein Tex/SPT6